MLMSDNNQIIQTPFQEDMQKSSGLIIAVGILLLLILLMIAGCASAPTDQIDQIELMPAPDVYGDGLINPLPENDPIASLPYKGIMYATDRRPAGEDDPERPRPVGQSARKMAGSKGETGHNLGASPQPVESLQVVRLE